MLDRVPRRGVGGKMDGVRVVNVPSFPADYSKPVPLAVGSLDSR